MLVKEIVPTEQVVDVLCDVCGRSTKTTVGTNQYGSLSADFGYGSRHDGERYKVHLCEMCFFRYTRNNEGDASRGTYV